MNNRIYIATFSDGAIEEIREHNLNIELNHLCISENLDEEVVWKTINDINADLEKSKAEKVMVHGPFTEIIPASIDHLAVEVGLKRLNQAFDVCRRIGQNSMVVHSGHIPLLYFDSWHVEKSVFFWREFMKDKGDFHIYIENVFEDNPFIMKELIEGISDERVKLCLDIGHANAVTKDKPVSSWIKILGDYIGHLHIHNNDGTCDSHGPINEGSMDMKKIFRAIEENCRTDVTMTIESRSCQSSIKWLLDNKFIK